jgi:hypothetical protein
MRLAFFCGFETHKLQVSYLAMVSKPTPDALRTLQLGPLELE